ncbi:hypothetical protein [Cytobacillus purgationiresistens]|uniref:Uncharacterized protein n=1 Tax=Cytobacillus purgationiresistens TaxID=863449 RepID=A0ABU0AGW1_9BACI|nr:hypothetical protein [Cytobacillus purgationiresistens]MDQ0270488.1 hypothetical protein [Cytobacillus purgationiresistens]
MFKQVSLESNLRFYIFKQGEMEAKLENRIDYKLSFIDETGEEVYDEITIY